MTTHAPPLETAKLDACIHCGLCLPACPTYRTTGSEAESPRGRLYLMRKWVEGELDRPERIKPHLDQCLACHACETACPSGVRYGDLLFESREALASRTPWLQRMLKRWVFQFLLPSRPALTLIRVLTRLYQRLGLQRLVRNSQLLKGFPHLAAAEALLPDLGGYHALQSSQVFGKPDRPTALLFTGCVMDLAFNPVHWATMHVLVANGYRVVFPKETCCGALAHHAGEGDITRQLARRVIDDALSCEPDWIVVNASGCGSTMQAYGDLLKDDARYAGRAKIFSEKTIDVMALLARQPLAPVTTPPAEPVYALYHAACHLHHVQRVQTETQALLSQVPQIRVTPIEDYDLCCGSAGIYNLEHPQLADEILALKIEAIKNTLVKHPASVLTTGNPGCLLQIQKGLQQAGIHLPAVHPVMLLAKAYGFNPTAQGEQSAKGGQR